MSFWDFTRSVAGARILVEFGNQRGIGSDTLLQGTGLSQAQLDDAHAELSAGQELRLTGNLLRAIEPAARHGLGIAAGASYHFSSYGLWGYGLISSATMLDAIGLALRFIPLTYAYTLISFREEGGAGVLSFGEPDLDPELRHFVVARDMMAAALLLRELGGPDFRLLRFSLKAPVRRGGGPETAEVFGARVQYGADSNHLRFDASHLRLPLPQANPLTAAMCAQMCGQLVERRRVRSGSSAIVRHYLGMPGSTPPDLATMARLMNTSERTLKRRLAAEGTTFRALLDEARKATADELLAEASLPLGEIALRLGFSDSSSFSQTFKRWHGVSPGQYRRQKQTP